MSPVRVKKIDGYRVSTPSGVKSKSTTKKKALAQERLLNMKEHGITPKGGWRKQRGVPLSSFTPKKKKGR